MQSIFQRTLKSLTMIALIACVGCAAQSGSGAPNAEGCSCPKGSAEACAQCPHCKAGIPCGGAKPGTCGHHSPEKKGGCFGATGDGKTAGCYQGEAAKGHACSQ